MQNDAILTDRQLTGLAPVARSVIFAYRNVGSYQQILGASSLVMKAHRQIRTTANNSQVRTWYYGNGGRYDLCALL